MRAKTPGRASAEAGGSHPRSCRSLWNPNFPVFLHAVPGGHKVKILQVATQGLLYLEWPYDFQLDFLYYCNLGTRCGGGYGGGGGEATLVREGA